MLERLTNTLFLLASGQEFRDPGQKIARSREVSRALYSKTAILDRPLPPGAQLSLTSERRVYGLG
jgi:hypothetical protein